MKYINNLGFLSGAILFILVSVSPALQADDNVKDSDVLSINNYSPDGNNMTEEQRAIANQKAKELEYKLNSGDVIDIKVFGEPDMNVRLLIDKEGTLMFPYIGLVQVAGKTPRQVEDEITNRLKGDYLLDPVVSVTLAFFRKFYIVGEVEDPDGYEYRPDLTVEKALALAGGFTDRADRDEINIRRSEDGELLEGVDMTHKISPGDTVIVEMSFF